MNADAQKSPIPNANDACACGYPSGRPWRYWPLIPLSIFGAIAALLVVAWAMGVRPPWSGAAPWFWPFFPIGFFLGLLLLFILLRWTLWGGWWGAGWRIGSGWQFSATPEEVLRLRYARGDISSDEFRRLKDDLRIS